MTGAEIMKHRRKMNYTTDKLGSWADLDDNDPDLLELRKLMGNK